MREKRCVGTVMKTPTGEGIDTRIYGGSCARHCAKNNRLKEVGLVKVEKLPSLFSSGSIKKSA